MSAEESRSKRAVCNIQGRASTQHRRRDALLDAMVSAAALVARANDGCDAGKHDFIVDVLARNGAFAAAPRADIAGAFDYRLHDVQAPNGVEMALERLRRISAARRPALLSMPPSTSPLPMVIFIERRWRLFDRYERRSELRRDPHSRFEGERMTPPLLRDPTSGRRTKFGALVEAESEACRRERRIERLIGRLPARLQGAVRWLRRPSSRWARIPAGTLLILGGLLSILPLLGIWMLPLGLILLSEDVPLLERARERILDWIERRRPHWLR